MGANNCPACGIPIPTASINLAEGVALCASCGKLSRLSEIADPRPPVEEVLRTTPPGCSVNDRGGDIVVRISARSIGAAGAAAAVALFWNGILSVFLLFAAGGLYTHFIGPLPSWFPSPGHSNMSLGETLFLCIFLTPFVLVGTGMIFAMIYCLFGSLQVRLRGADGRVRTGVGPFQWTRRFDATAVKSVKIGKTSWKQNDQHKPIVVIEADRTVNLGSSLPERKLEWLRAVLTVLLLETDSRQRDRLQLSRFKPHDYRRP